MPGCSTSKIDSGEEGGLCPEHAPDVSEKEYRNNPVLEGTEQSDSTTSGRYSNNDDTESEGDVAGGSDSAAENDARRPLAQYEHSGYALGGGSDERLALDAAVKLTASNWGPPFGTRPDETSGGWGQEAYKCASGAVEHAIVDALTATSGDSSGGTDDKTTEHPYSDKQANRVTAD